MAEVQGRQVDKVEDDEQLGPTEIRTHKQHDEAEVEQVVENEVASH